MTEITKRLAEPFAPNIVSFRVGPTTKDKARGMALAYIDARDVMRRLDEVCGPENWQDEYPWSDGKRVVCRIGIKIDRSGPDGGGDTEWIWKTDGAGDTDTEGEKGALSDAFKRAAVKWGVGRYLYDVDSPWVEIEQRGGSYVIKQSELARLRSNLPAPRTFPAPVANGNGAVLPVSPEEPPEMRLKRAAVRIAGGIETAPSDHVCDLVMDDARDDLAAIEAVREPIFKFKDGLVAGVEAAKRLRARHNSRIAELRSGK